MHSAQGYFAETERPAHQIEPLPELVPMLPPKLPLSLALAATPVHIVTMQVATPRAAVDAIRADLIALATEGKAAEKSGHLILAE